MVTHTPPYSGPTVKIWNFSKIQDGGSRHLENHKNRDYLRNGLTDLYEIWYTDAKLVS